MTKSEQLASDKDFRADCAAMTWPQLFPKWHGAGHSKGTIYRARQHADADAASTKQETPEPMTDPSADLAASFFEGTPSTITAEIVDESCENLQLQVVPATQSATPTTIAHKKRAMELHSRAVAQTSDLFETLDAIREEKAFLSLGHTSFENYVKALKREAEYLSIDVTTFYRKLAHREVKDALHEANIDARNLTQQQAALLNKLPPGLQAETYKLAQEMSSEEPPQGKAGQFHHPGKVYLDKLEAAIEQVTSKVLDEVENGEPDPFEKPEVLQPVTLSPRDPLEEAMLQPRTEILPDAPPVYASPVPPRTPEPEAEPIMLTFIGIERRGDYLFVTGDSGGDLYTVPMRLNDVREKVGK